MKKKKFAKSRKQDLEGIAIIFEQEGFSLCEINDILLGIGWQSPIEFNPNDGVVLAKENPERFIRVGDRLAIRKLDMSDEQYREICIKKAIYLYEQYPIAFEFYDELTNGLDEVERIKQKIKSKK